MSMNDPQMSSLLKRVDSPYTLAMVAAKRARMLTEGAQKLTDNDSTKDVTIALHEIDEGEVSYHRVYKAPPTHENMVETSLNSKEDAV